MTAAEQAKAAAEKAAEQKETKQAEPVKAAEQKEKKESKKDVDSDLEAKYQKFAELKFAMFKDNGYSRKNIKDKALEVFDALEKEIKTWKGKKPTTSKTVFIGVGVGNARIVEGYPVPDSLYKKFKDAGISDVYFK